MRSQRNVPLEEYRQRRDWIRESPKDNGVVRAIVVRPITNEREELQKCELSPEMGVHGDNWSTECWLKLEDGSPHPDVQVAMMNARVIELLTQDRSRWQLSGDQLFIDFDLSRENVVTGQRLQLGTAALEITDREHSGCGKFSNRFGIDALKFVNSPQGRQLRLRGIYAKIVKRGNIAVGDRVKKLGRFVSPSPDVATRPR